MWEARSAARSHLRRHYCSYRRGHASKVSCQRTGRLRAWCPVSWRYAGRRYRGTVKVRTLDANTLRISSRIRWTATAATASAASARPAFALTLTRRYR
jgi:hypothetical protein